MTWQASPFCLGKSYKSSHSFSWLYHQSSGTPKSFQAFTSKEGKGKPNEYFFVYLLLFCCFIKKGRGYKVKEWFTLMFTHKMSFKTSTREFL